MALRDSFRVRLASVDDAPAAAELLQSCFGQEASDAGEIAGWVQTGSTILLAVLDGEVRGLARQWNDEGVDWFDLLCSTRPWAGRALLQALERMAQDRGIRLIRTTAPADAGYEDYFGRAGFWPVSRVQQGAGEASLVFERRVPLLTVREQRRTDSAHLARLTGGDPWDFEYALRPGWFVLADGDRFAGYVRVRDLGNGRGEISAPAVLPSYEERKLELWMVERGVHYSETNGLYMLTLTSSPALELLGRELEEAGWSRTKEGWNRNLVASPSYRSGAEGLPPDDD